MLHQKTEDDSGHFLLGTVGVDPLVCVGVNPSTASAQKLDRTVTRVARHAELNGHDSWAMLNLLPAAVDQSHGDARRTSSGSESNE